jgi:hypothetical protein
MPNPPYNFIIQLNSDSYIKIRGDTSALRSMPATTVKTVGGDEIFLILAERL